MKKDKKIINNKKTANKDWNKILLISLLVLLALDIVLIPCLVYAEVKRILPIVAFLVLPILCGIGLLLLSRNCITDYYGKKQRLIKKNNKTN